MRRPPCGFPRAARRRNRGRCRAKWRAEAQPFAGALGREEGFEDAVERIGGQAAAGIGDRERNSAVGGTRGGDLQHAFRAGEHGVRSIADEVDQHLLQTVGVAPRKPFFRSRNRC